MADRAGASLAREIHHGCHIAGKAAHFYTSNNRSNLDQAGGD
jgi:hypothetical protein